MHTKSWILGGFLVTALFACTPESRNYGGEGGAGAQGGSGGSGGAGGQGGQGGDPAIEAICEEYGAAVCDRYAICSPAAITASFGDAPTCRERYALYCEALLYAPGTGWTLMTMAACFQTYATLECSTFLALPFRSFDDKMPPPCVPPTGTVPDNGACIDAAQCQSGACHRALGAFCGTCGPKTDPSGPCTLPSDCLPHYSCFQGVCTPAGELGESCDANFPCNSPWVCFGGTCAKPTVLGETCGGNGPDCDFLQGYACDTKMSYTCKAMPYANTGEACGGLGDVPTLCASSGICTSGACVAAAQDDESCNLQLGVGCFAPSICVNGKCTAPDADACN